MNDMADTFELSDEDLLLIEIDIDELDPPIEDERKPRMGVVK
jgi:hypothetical protein